MKKSLFLWLLLIWSITLAWCQKSDWEQKVSQYPVAEQVCLDNGWEVTVDEEWKDICLLGGRAIYLADMEENPEVPAEWAKTSLDMGELIWLIETHFPKSYTYTKYNNATNESEGEWKYVYDRMELGFLTPENHHMVDREVTSSGIEDGMIYTEVKGTMDDGRTINVLYVVDPETLNFVAANVEDGDITTNYQFSYDNIESLTYEDLEGIAENNFPSESTYTVVDLATEATTTGENVYMEDTPHNLVNITPAFPATTSQELLSSGIEDGMIYTLLDVSYENGTTGNVLYINDPETLNFVAATVESEGISTNYQFVY